MPGPLDLVASRAYPMLPGALYPALLPLPLPLLFAHGYGPIPAIGSVSDQVGAWGTVGQTRTIHLRGGGSMRELLLEVTAPVDEHGAGHFGYALTDLTGPLAALAAGVDGSWTVEPLGTGARVTWRWSIAPRTPLASAAMPLLGLMWRGYARKALDELERLLFPSS